MTYIAIEGIDGSGKSTQAVRLAEHLGALHVAEPGSTPFALKLREIVKDPETNIGPEAESLLFASARADLLHSVVSPALKDGRDVVSDRTLFSSLVYQGYRNAVDTMSLVWRANALATREHTIIPELVLQIDLDPETALSRRSGRDAGDRMEAITNAEDLIDGFNRLRQDIHTRFSAYATRWVKIDGLGTPDEVFEEIVEAVDKHHANEPGRVSDPLRNISSDRAVLNMRSSEVPKFERSWRIAVGTPGASPKGKVHLWRKSSGGYWMSACHFRTDSVNPIGSGDTRLVTCKRCSFHSPLFSHLDFSVDTSVVN